MRVGVTQSEEVFVNAEEAELSETSVLDADFKSGINNISILSPKSSKGLIQSVRRSATVLN